MSRAETTFIIEDSGRSGLTPEQVSELKFEESSKGYKIPYFYPKTRRPMLKPDGDPYTRERLRKPLSDGTKYLSPKNGGIHVYILPKTHEYLTQNPDQPLILTEGEKKAAKATFEGYPVVGLGGIWNWKHGKNNDALNTDLVPYVSNGRDVVIVYDSDATDPKKARDFDLCTNRLAMALEPYGCKLYRCNLPANGGHKVGLDDMFVMGGTVDQVREYIEENRNEVLPRPELPGEILDVEDWLTKTPPPPDQVIEDMLDKGSKCLVVGDSKAGKTWLMVNLAIALATQKPFIGLTVPNPRRVLVVQMELKPDDYHRRISAVLFSMGLKRDSLGGRLFVYNGRGVEGLLGDRLKGLMHEIRSVKADVVIFDPLYKLLDGDENRSEDVKPTLLAFDKITRETGATVVYVHHNPKGVAGDRARIDRGAGSGVLARDFDLGIYLTQHCDQGFFVIETEPRNYPQTAPFTVERVGAGSYIRRDDVEPVVRTSWNHKRKQTGPSKQHLATKALDVLQRRDTWMAGEFKAELERELKIGSATLREIMTLLTENDDVHRGKCHGPNGLCHVISPSRDKLNDELARLKKAKEAAKQQELAKTR